VLISGGTSVSEPFPPPWFSAARCTTADAIAADSDIDRLTNWAAIYRSFKQYGKCDDGGIAEGYSDAVARLLTEQWATVTTLAKQVQTDPMFGRFVLDHVDSLMSPEQNRTIIENASNRCPYSAKQFCKRLEAQARKPPEDAN
jgi:hypothetical protein